LESLRASSGAQPDSSTMEAETALATTRMQPCLPDHRWRQAPR
jgi:hypothetical protein